jgi:SAM-dependent methyltransferase
MEMNTNDNIRILSNPEKVDMADDWYQFADLNHFWIDSRFRAIKSKIKKEDIGENVFEIGCGHGAIIKQFEEGFNVCVDGCDLNIYALNQIRNVKGKIFCLDIYEKHEELLDKYDTVLLMDVIEHIEDDFLFLENSIKFIKRGGIVIINVPALNMLFSKYDLVAGHKRRYNKKMLQELFTKCGVEEISVSYWGFMLIPIAIIRKLMLKFVAKEKVISTGFHPPNNLSNRILNLILKAENKILNSPPIGTSLIGIGRVKRS